MAAVTHSHWLVSIPIDGGKVDRTLDTLMANTAGKSRAAVQSE